MAGIGHNRGPSSDGGESWRRHCWAKARADLLPVLPIEVVRIRVRRAAELGLDYKTYAGVRAATGHDLVAFLFSSNALGLLAPDPRLPAAVGGKLAMIAGAARIALARPPLTPGAVAQAAGRVIDGAHPAPQPFGSFAEARARLRAATGRLPPDQVLLVGDAVWETEWCGIARLAGYLPAERYFGRQGGA